MLERSGSTAVEARLSARSLAALSWLCLALLRGFFLAFMAFINPSGSQRTPSRCAHSLRNIPGRATSRPHPPAQVREGRIRAAHRRPSFDIENAALVLREKCMLRVFIVSIERNAYFE